MGPPRRPAPSGPSGPSGPWAGGLAFGQALLDAVDREVAGGLFRPLGSSRLGRPIVGGVFPGPGGGPQPLRAGSPASGGPRLLFVGGVHGDEPASVEALLELARAFAAPPRAERPAGEVMILPMLNPDGIAAGQKNSASDVDLNRNFPARNFTPAHAPGYAPGPSPLSEPETALLARLVDEQGIQAVVAVHAPFACVNFDGPARAWAEAVAHAAGWPARESIGYPTPGSLGSWLGVDRNLPILTLELPPGPLAGFRAAAAAALDAAYAAAPGPI